MKYSVTGGGTGSSPARPLPRSSMCLAIALFVVMMTGCSMPGDDGGPRGKSELVAVSEPVEASFSGAGVGRPYSIVGLASICVAGPPVTIVAATPISGTLRVSDWAVSREGDFGGIGNQRRHLRDTGFGVDKAVATACPSDGPSSSSPTVVSTVALEFVVPSGPGARMNGLRLTYDDGSGRTSLDVPLTVVMCSEGEITDECSLK